MVFYPSAPLPDSLTVGRRLGLKIKGTMAVCPFHEDATPSLSLSRTISGWNCFACGAKGNSLQLAERLLPATRAEARQWLGIDTHQRPSPASRRFATRSVRETSNSEHGLSNSALYAEVLNLLPLRDRGRAYLEGRRIDATVAAHFRFGEYDPAADDLRRLLSHWPDSVLGSAGLLARGGFLWRRPFLLIPFIHNGEIEYVQARSLDGGEPKYLNLKGVPRPVFNLDAIASAARGSEIVICEGVFDAVRAHVLSIPAIAVLGTGTLPHEVIERIRGLRVVLVPDSDPAGKAWADRLCADLVSLGLPPRTWRLPHGKDLDDWGMEATLP